MNRLPRRHFLQLLRGALLLPLFPGRAMAAEEVEYPVVQPQPLQFPRDHGAHSNYRTEWWYITGWLGEARGFQLTFFRNRPGVAEHSASAFAPRQLLFAHAALSEPERGRLLHDERRARAGFGLAEASENDTNVWIDDWFLKREGEGYRAQIRAADFAFDFSFQPTVPLLLQGEAGFSRKGRRPEEASHYYSWPQLAVSGTLQTARQSESVQGRAWLDHEWSSAFLAPEASGWDWTGINLEDGGALMAFQVRAHDGSAYWATAVWRDGAGRRTAYPRQAVRFETLREWRSPHTGIRYPVELRIHLGTRIIELVPLMDDQEMDATASTGTIYWEGAVQALQDGRPIGRGYLELTGYGDRLQV